LVTTDKALIRGAQSQISLWKNGLIQPEDALAKAKSEDEVQLARIFATYQATLAAYQAVDFDDLILRPVQFLSENNQVRDKWQNRLRYLLIDEVQDTNACQYELLKLLLGPRAMFTAVGDDDQAIYAWRGATLENLRQLTVDYPLLKVIKLEQNYRSTLHILQAANQLIENNPKLFPKTLWSEHGMGDPIAVSAMKDEEHEAESVAIMLSAHRFERRARFSDYAILYRSNHQARILEQALRKQKIPYIVAGGQSFFEKSEIKDILAYLRLLVNQDDDPAFIRAITTPKRGIGQQTLEVLGRYAAHRGVSLFEAAFESGLAQQLNARMIEPLRVFIEFITRFEERAKLEHADKVLRDLIAAIEYEHWLYEQHDERGAQARWQNVQDFVSWITEKSGVTHAETVLNSAGEKTLINEQIENLLELTQKIALITMLDRQEDEGKADAVQLSTLHASKGLEFPHVFLIGCEETVLPNYNDEAERFLDDDKLQEERRLMYVGVTRAQRSLTITHCSHRKRGRDMVRALPSRFIAELGLEKGIANSADETPGFSPKQRLSALRDLLLKKT
jgi:ATP-dependent DNA helicase Rep